MPDSAYRFVFNQSVRLNEAEMTLHLALIAAEGLHGAAGVRLDAHYKVEEAAKAIVVDAASDVGVALVRVFTALLIGEFGNDAFTVRCIDTPPRVAGQGRGGHEH